MEGYHTSVLLKEVMQALSVAPDKWYLDATLGDGGYTLEILQLGGKVLGLDVDPEALDRTKARLQATGIREQDYKLVQGNFRDLKNLILQTEIADQKFSGAIFDLGVSSLQLLTPTRGFSFAKDGPLDMRMDPTLGVSALDLINVLDRKELYELFSKLGEEKYSKRLADALVSSREIGKGTGNRQQGTVIQSTRDLVELIEEVYRKAGERQGRIHPATKAFQALRIAVNDELGALIDGLEQIKEKINKNGHVIIISFHSLEDRIVKNTFRDWQEQGIGEVVTKKPIIPSEDEIRQNPRSRSAKMRIFKIL